MSEKEINPSKLCREANSNNLLNMVICMSNENARQIVTHKLNFNLKYLNNVTSVIIILFPVLSTVDLNYTQSTTISYHYLLRVQSTYDKSNWYRSFWKDVVSSNLIAGI